MSRYNVQYCWARLSNFFERAWEVTVVSKDSPSGEKNVLMVLEADNDNLHGSTHNYDEFNHHLDCRF